MIASVRGPVLAVGLDHAVLEAGGVGLALLCPPRTLADLRVGEPARLASSLVVRDDSLTLYGFAGDDERVLFEQLLGVSGIGPRLALAMLAVLTPDEVRQAVATDDLATLTRVPGIGRKGAQRLVLELKDRIGPPDAADAPVLSGVTPGHTAAWAEQVHAALVGLGWAAREAAEAVQAVTPVAQQMLDEGTAPDVPVLLRTALRSLDRAP
ncbi:MAG: Holliday junction branch migration protein RuvA [Actinomycetia bacterium]|jgi:Holliday junction DNA helicase RuvA|nr:Holliday junction branch migration protein RuvA [Actinomycetes bacterium]